MPIPPLQNKSHDEEHDDHHGPNIGVTIVKWVLTLGVIAGIGIFFISADKQKLYERISSASETAERFDDWTSRAAEAAVSFFAD